MEGVFFIGENNIGCKEKCLICGETHKANLGFTIFFENEDGLSLPVCHECQEGNAPELRKMLDFHYGENYLNNNKQRENDGLVFRGKLEEYIKSLPNREPATVLIEFDMSGHKEVWIVTEEFVHVTGVDNYSEGLEDWKIKIEKWQMFFNQGLSYNEDDIVSVVDLKF